MLRRGFSLIEVLVVLTVGAVVVGIGVGMLHMLMRIEQTGRDRVPQAGILARLAEQFRSDVGAAVRQAPGARQGEWQFVMTGDRLITYRALAGEIRWDERRAGKPVRQESYVLPSGCSATITVRSEATAAVASLVIADNGTPLAAGREMRVTAVLGKDIGSPSRRWGANSMGCCDFQRRRRGAVLIVVLVCLAVAAAISVVVVRQIAMERHGVQMNQRGLQASWLAEAGVERAAARLAADPKYAGETWIISAKELAADDSGRGENPSGNDCRPAGAAVGSRRGRLRRRPGSPLPAGEADCGGPRRDPIPSTTKAA